MIDLDNFYAQEVAITPLTEISDEHLISCMLKLKIATNVFFAAFDLDKIRLKSYPPSNYEASALMMEAIRRYKSRAGSRAGLASRIQKSVSTVLTAGALVVQDKVETAELKIVRGTVQTGDNKEDKTLHAFGAIVQLYKPVLVEKKFTPVITDPTGTIYPTPTMTVPKFVSDAYARSATGEEIAYQCAAAVKSAATQKAYIQMIGVPPRLLERVQSESKSVMSLTHMYGPASAEVQAMFTKFGVPASNMTVYTGLPKVLSDVTNLDSAYDYLEKSRKVRGDSNKGLSFNTANYYYGDLPNSYMRALSIAHNLIWVYQELAKRDKSLTALYMNNDNATFTNAYEIVALNMPIASVSAKPEYHKTPIPNVGWSPLKKGGKYLVPFYVERNMSKKKGNSFYSFTPDYPSMNDSLTVSMSVYDALAIAQGVKFTYVVLTKMDNHIMKNHNWLHSVHAHNGSVWFLPKTKGIKDTTKAEINFCSRLVAANAWKNYYPFHRVPFAKFDVDPKFHIFLKRKGVCVPSVVALDLIGDGGAHEEDDTEEQTSVIMARLALLDVSVEAMRFKSPENVAPLMEEFDYEIESSNVPGGNDQVAAVFNSGGDADGF